MQRREKIELIKYLYCHDCAGLYVKHLIDTAEITSTYFTHILQVLRGKIKYLISKTLV